MVPTVRSLDHRISALLLGMPPAFPHAGKQNASEPMPPFGIGSDYKVGIGPPVSAVLVGPLTLLIQLRGDALLLGLRLLLRGLTLRL